MKINLGKIINQYDLNKSDLADLLFPTLKHPKFALYRIIRGEGDLSSDQIEKLASILGKPIDNLFEKVGWQFSSKGEKHIFKKNGFIAELQSSSGSTVIFLNGKKVQSFTIDMLKTSVKDYIEYLDFQFNKLSVEL